MANQANKQAAVSEQGCSGVLTSIGTMRAESAVVAKTGSISSIMERCAGIFFVVSSCLGLVFYLLYTYEQ